MSNLELFVLITTAIIVILFVSQICGRLITYVGQPKVVGEMIAGVLLGPTFFGAIFPDLSNHIFPDPVMPGLFILSNLGLSIYMFLVGAEIDFGLFNKKAIRDAGWLSFSAMIFPFILGLISANMFWEVLKEDNVSLLSFTFFMGTALAITAFPMLARILQENNLINTKIGVLSLLSASIQDVISWIFLSFVTAIAFNKSYSSGLVTLFGAIIFVLIIFFIVKPLIKKMNTRAEKKGFLNQADFGIIIILLLASALITDHLGIYSVFGGFILGLGMPRGLVFKREINNKLKDITLILLLPIFFAFSGLKTNLLVLSNFSILYPCIVIVLFAFISKYLTSTLTMKISGFSWRESSAIGGLVNARGLMELLVANIGLSYGIINEDMFSILVLVAVTTTFAAMPIFNFSIKKIDLRKKEEGIKKEIDRSSLVEELILEAK